jgi:cytochrome P450
VAGPARILLTDLPPGRTGLPGIGETLPFVRNPYRFLEDRHARYGNVFRSNVVGHRTVFLAGIEGAEAFYHPGNISRERAHPFLLVDMFGGRNFEMYDGPKHLALKTISLEAFDDRAIAGYLPDMQRLVEGTLGRLAGVAEFSAMRELRRLAIEAICWNLMGIPPGPDTESLTRDYGVLLAGLAAPVPLRIPGTTYGRAMAARDRLLDGIREVIRARRDEPGVDGLSRMLAGEFEGRRYEDDDAVLEVHHIVVAGFVVYALLAEVLRRLAEQPELRERCAREIATHAPDADLTIDRLERLSTGLAVVMETKRFVPLVPLAFGRSRRAFVCEGRTVPAGWNVYLALHLVNRDPTIYRDPERFDPDRFPPPREEHRRDPMAFIPQGGGPPTGHRCLGLDYSTALALVFLAVAVRGFGWDLPPQDLEYDWSRRPPGPRDGLRIRLRHR